LKLIASSHLASIPLLMLATEADDRHLAAGKLAKAISRRLASYNRAAAGWCRAGRRARPASGANDHDRDHCDTSGGCMFATPGTPCPDQAAAESAEKTSRTMAPNPNR
jgi:hypothetical protein